MVRQITLGDVEFLAHQLAQELLTFNEPIPDFKTRFPNRLESCLVTPFLMFGGRSLYPTLIAKASILFYPPTQKTPAMAGDECVGRILRSTAEKDCAKEDFNNCFGGFRRQVRYRGHARGAPFDE